MAVFPNADQIRRLPEPRRVLFIVNPGAGTGRAEALRETVASLAGTDIPHRIVQTRGPGHATRLAREAVRDGQFDRLAAVGGDGTVMEVITGTIGSGMPINVIPAGTGNVIAVETGTPLDLTLATTLALSEAGVTPFDLGWSGGRYFAARLGVGMEAEMVRTAARGAKKKYGRLGYMITAVKAWRQRRLARYAIALDDQIIMRRAHTVFLTNVANLGLSGVNLSTAMSPADGHLDLCILRADNAGKLLRAVGSIVTDTNQRGEWEILPVYHGVEIRSVPRQRVQVDGEPAGVTPTMAAVLPHMARLVVPLPVPAAALEPAATPLAVTNPATSTRPAPSEGGGLPMPPPPI